MSLSRTGLVLTILTAGLPASASDLVVYQGESSSFAISRVVLATGADISGLEAIDIGATLTAASPGLAGPGSLNICSSEDKPTLATIQGALDHARSDVQFMDYEAASISFEKATTAIACLTEPLDATLAGTLYYLKGISHLGQADKPSAWEAFRQARLLNPQLQWDESFAPEGKPTFIAAVAELEATSSQSLYLIPSPGEGELMIDGVPIAADTVSVDLRQGEHLVQWTTGTLQTATLKLVAGPDPVLLLSPQIPSDLLSWTQHADPERQAAVRASLGALAGEHGAVYISTPEGIWQTQIGSKTWTQLEGAPSVEAVQAAIDADNQSDTGRRTAPVRALGFSLLGSGAGLTIAGTAVALRGYTASQSAYESVVDPDSDQIREDMTATEYSEHALQYENGQDRLIKGLVMASAGGALTAGAVWGIYSLRVSPMMGPASTLGLRLEKEAEDEEIHAEVLAFSQLVQRRSQQQVEQLCRC